MLLVALAAAVAGPARALDLEEARRDGRVLAQALDIAERAGWRAAESHVAGTGDPLLRDIVLWRKLRAGEGTLAEYRSFTARRPDWPGKEPLARAVLGALPEARPERPLTRLAQGNWNAFNRLWRSRDWDEAERLLEEISTRPEGLGTPRKWADRRRVLARRAAREGRERRAYHIASRHYLTPAAGYAYADLEWLSGWIALRRLDDPELALAHFERFVPQVTTPISLGRGHYWIGRAHAAAGETEAAHAAYARAARQQTSFYGQLAAAEINAPGDPALAGSDLPDWRVTPAMRDDRARLAAILEFAGEESLAFQTFAHLGRVMPAPAIGALGALALELGRPNYAVRLSKRAARRGIVVPPGYYPLHPLAGYAREVEPALAMSIARQETELNPEAVSPAGARGLMQLMPATARKVSGWIGEPYDRARLTGDWRYNARLGQRYLARRIERYGGSYVLAAAAYNAGAHRVDDWIERFGDPRAPWVDTVDWIESIPFRETRNYVQRVIEGLYVYRTRLSGEAGPMTVRTDLARGALQN